MNRETTQAHIRTHLPKRKDSECEACGGLRLRFWIAKEGVDFVRCAGCGLAQRRQLPPLQELFELYENFAREYYLEKDKKEIDEGIDHSERLQEIRSYRKNGRLLDVGCSTGGFLKAAQKEGWEPYGVDLSPTVAEFCKKDGLKVFAGPLVESGYPDEFFDVVRLWATLEHATEPFPYLQEAHRILRKGGLLLFSVPNVDCLIFRLLGKRYRYICPEHLYYYSKHSIRSLMSRAGFSHFRVSAKTFDAFSFLEDWKGKKLILTAQTAKREREFVQAAKQSWYHQPLKMAYRFFLRFLETTELGDIWFVYAEKE